MAGAAPRPPPDRLLRPQRGEPVLEDHHVAVIIGGDLRQPAFSGRVERALLGRRQECPVLALGGDDHPFAGERVPAEPGRGSIFGHAGLLEGVSRPVAERAPVGRFGPAKARRLVVEDDLAPVRQAGAFLPVQICSHGTHTVAGTPVMARTHQARAANDFRPAGAPAAAQSGLPANQAGPGWGPGLPHREGAVRASVATRVAAVLLKLCTPPARRRRRGLCRAAAGQRRG